MKSLLMSTKSTSWNITLQCLTSPLDAVQFTVAAESLLAEMATPFWSVSPACGRCVVMSVQLCVKHCCLPRWWMHLFVAQVRRHPWWDRPTVHHSPAPTFSSPPLLRCYSPPPPFILPFPFQLYMTNGLHMKCALRYLAIFFPPPATSLSSPYQLIASFSCFALFLPSPAVHRSQKAAW